MNARIQSPAETYDYVREVYSVDAVQVTLDNRGWHCVCKAYAQGSRCSHVERAAVFKQMRGVRRADETIEVELTATQLQALAEQPAAADVPQAATLQSAQAAERGKSAPLRLSRWAAITTAAAVAAVSSGITYLATAGSTTMPEPAPVAYEAPPAPPPEAVAETPAAEEPVTFVNPFDTSEVFEFPAETSTSDARAAVAELLLKRAQERLASSPTLRRTDKTANRKRPVIRTSRLAQRS